MTPVLSSLKIKAASNFLGIKFLISENNIARDKLIDYPAMEAYECTSSRQVLHVVPTNPLY